MPARRRRERPDFPLSSYDCADCRAACLNSPGWFMPDQVPRLVAASGLPLEELFRTRLGVGVTRMPDGSTTRGVMPHKLQDRKKPGGLWTLEEIARPGRCVFFDRGRCTIYAHRPYECARMIHGDGHDAVALRRRVAPAWRETDLAPYLELAAKRGRRRR